MFHTDLRTSVSSFLPLSDRDHLAKTSRQMWNAMSDHFQQRVSWNAAYRLPHLAVNVFDVTRVYVPCTDQQPHVLCAAGSWPAHLQTVVFQTRRSVLRKKTFPINMAATVQELANIPLVTLREQPLPPSLTNLHLGDFFNETLSVGQLPNSLLSLRFGKCFNQHLPPGVLPASLLELRFGYSHNQQFAAGELPSHLLSLKMGSVFRSFWPGVLPLSLRVLRFSKYDFCSIRTGDGLPENLERLKVYGGSNVVVGLPTSLRRLTWYDMLSHHVISCTSGTASEIPELPCQLERLSVKGYFNGFLQQGSLPAGLRHLRLGPLYNNQNKALLPGVLPASLTTLRLGDKFNQVLGPDVLPPSLTHLQVGYAFCFWPQNVFPASLRYLTLPHDIHLPLPRGDYCVQYV